jgi:hypothetical protein
VENTKLKSGETRESIRTRLAATDRRYRAMLSHDPQLLGTTCAPTDYAQMKTMLNHLTDPTTLDQSLVALKTPKDPFKGDCL